MGKVKDMDMTIRRLRSAADAIIDAADWLAEQFSGNGDITKDAKPSEKPLTLEEVRAVLATASRKGHTAEVRELLLKYGSNKLSEVDPVDYKALLADAEVFNDAT